METNEVQIGTLNAALAAVLRGARGEKRLSVPALSALSGVEKNSLQRYLIGKREIRIEVLEKLAPALGSTPAKLMAEAEVKLANSIPHPRSGGTTTPEP